MSYYLKRMSPHRENQLTFEKSASYIRYEGVALKVSQLMPDAKFIVVVRNPVDR